MGLDRISAISTIDGRRAPAIEARAYGMPYLHFEFGGADGDSRVLNLQPLRVYMRLCGSSWHPSRKFSRPLFDLIEELDYRWDRDVDIRPIQEWMDSRVSNWSHGGVALQVGANRIDGVAMFGEGRWIVQDVVVGEYQIDAWGEVKSAEPGQKLVLNVEWG